MKARMMCLLGTRRSSQTAQIGRRSHTTRNGSHVLVKNSDAEYWQYMLRWFPADEYRIIAPDLRACGRSWMPADEYVAQDALATTRGKGLKDFTIVGHSTGGVIAQWLAAELIADVKSLALIGPAPATVPPVNDAARALFLRAQTARIKLRVVPKS